MLALKSPPNNTNEHKHLTSTLSFSVNFKLFSFSVSDCVFSGSSPVGLLPGESQHFFNHSHSVFILSLIFHFKEHISALRTKPQSIYSAAEKKTSLVSDRNRTEALNVKSSSPEPVTQFLRTLITVELFSVGPLSFPLAALQITLLFLRMASLLHAALLCLSFIPPPHWFSYLSSSVFPSFY